MKNQRSVGIPHQRAAKISRMDQLRACATDYDRGMLCLAWAEKARRTIDSERVIAQDVAVQRFEQAHKRAFGMRNHANDASGLTAAKINGDYGYRTSPRFRDLVGDDQMYTRWADTYFAAYTAKQLAQGATGARSGNANLQH